MLTKVVVYDMQTMLPNLHIEDTMLLCYTPAILPVVCMSQVAWDG